MPASEQARPGSGGVAIIVVNYNGNRVLDRLAASLDGLSCLGRWPVLVDNASSDGAASKLEVLLPGASILRNERNLGPAAAINPALRVGRGLYMRFSAYFLASRAALAGSGATAPD